MILLTSLSRVIQELSQEGCGQDGDDTTQETLHNQTMLHIIMHIHGAVGVYRQLMRLSIEDKII